MSGKDENCFHVLFAVEGTQEDTNGRRHSKKLYAICLFFHQFFVSLCARKTARIVLAICNGNGVTHCRAYASHATTTVLSYSHSLVQKFRLRLRQKSSQTNLKHICKTICCRGIPEQCYALLIDGTDVICTDFHLRLINHVSRLFKFDGRIKNICHSFISTSLALFPAPHS